MPGSQVALCGHPDLSGATLRIEELFSGPYIQESLIKKRMAQTVTVLFGAFAPLLITACQLFQTENSFSGDDQRYSETSPGSANFESVRAVLRANCASCHATFLGYSEQDWINNAFVNPGSPSTSYLYARLRGSETGGDEDMPPSGALSAEELGLIESWISALAGGP
jgi:uncharacterized membrane protein